MVMHGLVVGVSILVHQDCPSIRALRYLEPASSKSKFFEHERAALFWSITMSRYPFGFSKSAIYHPFISDEDGAIKYKARFVNHVSNFSWKLHQWKLLKR